VYIYYSLFGSVLALGDGEMGGYSVSWVVMLHVIGALGGAEGEGYMWLVTVPRLPVSCSTYWEIPSS